jgi:hypothetical protein
MMRWISGTVVLVVIAGCNRPAKRDDGEAPGVTRTAAAAPAPKPVKKPERPEKRDPMFGQVTKKALPSPFDQRVDAVLAEPVPDDVVVRFASVARAKLPFTNYRWDLNREGALFYVKHSGTNKVHWTTPFDRPLPARPSRSLGKAKVAEVLDELRKQGFFAHPGYELTEGTRDGQYVIVRARQDDRLHTVVYENVKSPLLDYLYGLAVGP